MHFYVEHHDRRVCVVGTDDVAFANHAAQQAGPHVLSHDRAFTFVSHCYRGERCTVSPAQHCLECPW